MPPATLILTAIGLSMDAFSVSVCKGVTIRKKKRIWAILFGLTFGGFQAAMPLLGYLLGTRLQKYIEAADHWIAFVLLAFLGGKMLWEAFHKGEKEELPEQPVSAKELLLLGIATSIDALAVGISFALLKINIFSAAGLIGGITFLLSALGVYFGAKLGEAFGKKALIAGGVILVAIGIKILLEHLFY
ncbi:MAG: manganese efflux pump MntP family protein [Oscillospiraceae bacterium]|jgi:putative Mn2+ efflux pump MntP|nr:manganese efflux pump MntP family protein [Oscillospiraceae bacterium]